VTYSVTAAQAALGGRGVLETYQRIQAALARALVELGVPAELAPGEERGRVAHPSCFAGASPADGVVRGRKLIGSAQGRRRGALLQHGSLLIDQDAGLWERLFGPGNRGLALAELLGGPPAEEVVCQALVSGFEAALGVRMRAGEYTPEEERVAQSLVVKHAAPIPHPVARGPGEVA
jgi:lipoate-protein ligase A